MAVTAVDTLAQAPQGIAQASVTQGSQRAQPVVLELPEVPEVQDQAGYTNDTDQSSRPKSTFKSWVLQPQVVAQPL